MRKIAAAVAGVACCLSFLIASPSPASAHEVCARIVDQFYPYWERGEACVSPSHWEMRVRDQYEDGRGVFVDFYVQAVPGTIYRLRDDDGANNGWETWPLLSEATYFRVCVRDLRCSAPASPATGWTRVT